MPKKNKKRRKRKILIFLLSLIVIALLLFLAYKYLDSSIRNIYIHDNVNVTDQEIIEMAGLKNYPDFYKTTSYSIKKKILKNSLIKDVKIKKRIFNQLHIYITEYKILFVRQDTNKVVLDDGNEINYTKELVNVPILINYVPDKKYKTLINKLIKVNNKVTSKISEIKYDANEYDDDRFLLYMNDGNYVYITLTKTYLLDKYNEAVTKFEGKTGILYLDSGNYFKIIE